MPDIVSASTFAAHDELPDWRYLLNRIEASFRLGTFDAAGRLAADIASAADAAGHHPDIDLRYPDVVHVALTTHAAHGVTNHDLALAATISDLATKAGARSEPVASQAVEVAIDAMNIDAVRPFWKAVLGYVDGVVSSSGTVVDLVDPARIGPAFWFQQMDEPRTERNRFHIDVDVSHEVAEERIAAALAAGGTMVTDQFAKAWWVLADPEGNEACICTWQDRN
jgi:4a-hydroxytetrahydrobiopterin dehydratase